MRFSSIRLIVFLLSLLLFVGCVSMPSQQELDKLDYGTPLTPADNYEAKIKLYFSKRLYDPYSAHYEIGFPQQYWYKASPLMGGKLYAGYMVFVDVNAKNLYGAYTGTDTYGFIFKNGDIIKVLSPGEVKNTKNPYSL
ncbi:MAG: hypothetical protein IJJ26_13455 [Victivallales bacterium]|nr:hypothetical protein [Victivallales bacterium]